MRRNQVRALQQRRRGLPAVLAVSAFALLTACAGDELPGIWPKDPLPPAPATQLPYPSLNTPNRGSDEQRGLLTPYEVKELEEKLTKQAVDREKGVERRIDPNAPKGKTESSKKAKSETVSKPK